jgi:hypothetical protein
VLLAFGLVGPRPAGAQSGGFTIGLKGGLNVSTVSVDDPARPDLEIDSRRDFQVGAYLQCGGLSRFTMQGEVVYSQNGAKLQDEGPATELKLDYLRVPVLFMVRLGSTENPVDPIVYAGPQLAFETRCQVATDENGVSTSLACNSEELDRALDTNKVEFGLVFGGGVEMPLSSFVMQLDARYNLGLTNVNGGTDASGVSLKNRGWSFSVGVGKPFG